MKHKAGFAHILLLVLFVAIAIGVVGFYAIKQKGLDGLGLTKTNQSVSPMPSLSPSTDVNTIQQELDATYVEPVDAEFSSISAQVKSL